MEHPLPITLGLFWIGLIAVAIFWIGIRVYGSRRSALILMGISTAGFVAGAIVHPFSGHGDLPAPAAAFAPQAVTPAPSEPPAGPARLLTPMRSDANNESSVGSLTMDNRPAAGSVDEFGFTNDGGNVTQSRPLVVPAGSSLVLQGWLIVPTTKTPPTALFVLVDGTKRLGGDYEVGISRPDVAHALNNDSAAKSGFSLLVRTAGLAAGPHRLQLEGTDGTQAFALPIIYDFSVR